MSTTKTWTYDDYAALDDGKRYEVIDGELIEMVPGPDDTHQSISMSLAARLYSWIQSTGCGVVRAAPYDVVLAEGVIFQPDIVYISKERDSIRTARGAFGAPDLCVEILSPSTARRDTGVKAKRYFEYGVTEYWIADPKTKTIDVLIRGEESFELSARFGIGDTLTSALFDGFELALSEVFA